MRVPEAVRCPDCGTEIVTEPGIPGLCPQCLLSLALKESPAASPGDRVEPETADAAPRTEATLDRLDAGRILGERYQIRELLGRGGMGEVFRAFDLKLRVDVALKAVRPEKLESERAREALRREVRSAREVVSPNVCRIFDLVAEEGQELVSMEFIDGATLADTLKQRGPLPLSEAREIAAQFLSGLEAIHQAGLVHRDFKPENVMLTRAGRVVVMDFGLAKAASGRAGTISGTPAYMAPEQARGEPLDARADVFAAALVLAEMLSVGGVAGQAEAGQGRAGQGDEGQAVTGGDASRPMSRRDLWRAVRETPPRVPDSPWAAVLRQALSPVPEERPASARALARALEDVTQRLPGFETERPYPGLSSFTEEDAGYFFGRELEVEALWKKLRRPRLLALVGPSGAGKSSFLRAGLLPALPRGWKALVATPGHRPFQALAQSLVPAFAGDTDAMAALLRFEEPDTAVSLLKRFRQRHEHALLIVDQFEELFTLCPPEAQRAFASLLARLVLDADVHVLLSLRDDFLVHCHEHEPLAPATSDLTILGPLGESALRRALVQPALKCGYRFEDESLVDEMIGAVANERGALPLLAFAASRLWETRDRERGLVTRAAYREIGGVGGALAQHAEATLERIGAPRTPIVREIFRNLVTAQGTRAVRERDELLSLFESDQAPASTPGSASPGARRGEAEGVLDALIDARLLTSYERAGEGGESHREVEIVHESLLAAWPRLVRWQTQDQDGAQLRDQLRQAARLWHERGEPDDLLWSGQAYRDFALWRERSPVALTTGEEAFAKAMESSATRRRRRRRAVGVGVVVAAAAVGIATSVLWQRAESEGRRAEAGRLLALGQLEREGNPTAALAWTLRSLEVHDTPEARLLALGVLQAGPTASFVQAPPLPRTEETDGLESHRPRFSPDGAWLAVGGYRRVRLLSRDGKSSRAFGDYPSAGFNVVEPRFGSSSGVVVGARLGDVRAWSVPAGRELWRRQGSDGYTVPLGAKGGEIRVVTLQGDRLSLHSVPERGGEPRLVGTVDETEHFGLGDNHLAYMQRDRVFVRALDDWSRPRRVGDDSPVDAEVGISPDGRLVAAVNQQGEIRIWPTVGATRPLRVLRAPGTPWLTFDRQGRRLAAFGVVDGTALARVFDLEAPAGTEPVELRRSDALFFNGADFDPTGQWLAAGNVNETALWALGDRRPRVMRSGRGPQAVAFTPDGEQLVEASANGVFVWNLGSEASEPSRPLLQAPLTFPGLALDPSGPRVAFSGGGGRVAVLPLAGGPPVELTGFSPHAQALSVVYADAGRLVAAAACVGPRDDKVVRVWDVATGVARSSSPLPGAGDGAVGAPRLLPAGPQHALAGVAGQGLLLVDLGSLAHRLVAPSVDFLLATSPDGRLALACASEFPTTCPPELVDLASGRRTALGSHGRDAYAGAFSPSGSLIAVGEGVDGLILVGPVSGGEPHVLVGHKGLVRSVAFSPDERWLASAGEDNTIRLWPVPDVTKTPLHLRPHAELLAVLRTHTNLRAEPDPKSSTGYKLAPGPFSGWATLPEWQ